MDIPANNFDTVAIVQTGVESEFALKVASISPHMLGKVNGVLIENSTGSFNEGTPVEHFPEIRTDWESLRDEARFSRDGY